MNSRCNKLWCVVLVWGGLMAGCVSTKHENMPAGSAALVWPLPPDPPRIRFVKSISTPADIGGHPSAWKRMTHFIIGEPLERDGFSKPFGIALDESGKLLLTDMGNNTVSCYDPAKKQWHRWKNVGKERLASPVAMVGKNGIFYVADSELGKVIAFKEDGREVFTISTPLERPAGLAIADDSLVVADSHAHCVFIFDLSGKLRLQFGKRGAGPGEFNFPTHVATDSQGHLLVTDSLNSRVQVLDGKGQFIAEIGSTGDTPGHFGRPKGVAVDGFGHIYVVDAVFDNIQIFDLSGQLLLSWGQGGSGPGEFGVPAGIAIGADNQIYVTDSYNRRVQVFKYVGQQ